MSIFGKVFGKKETILSSEEAIQKLADTEEMLQKQSDFIEKKIVDQINTAKQYGTKNKPMAIKALKRKKRFEKQLAQIDGTLSTLELQREALQDAKTNTDVLTVMGDAAKALKAAHQYLDPDQVHDLMGDIADQMELSEEIGIAMSTPIGFGQDMDDDELLTELEELEQESLEEKLLEVGEPTNDSLPSVPVSGKSKGNHEEDEMRELATWAS